MGKKHIDNMLKTWATLTVVILALLGFTTGCSKEGGCINSTGPVISEDRTLLISEFDTISLNDYVNLVLTQGPVDSVRVEAGRNIIKGITTEVINRTLIIHTPPGMSVQPIILNWTL
jgi:hypothetical protein